MRIRERKPSLVLVVVGILILLLPLLAYLQYDWLGKVSEREREQMQTALRHTLSQISEDFDREIGRIFMEFEDRTNWRDTEQLAGESAKIYAHWRASAPYPKLIRDVFLHQPFADEAARFQQLDTISESWRPSDWIRELGPRQELSDPIDSSIPAVVVPAFPQPLQSLDTSTPNLAWLIVRLDLEYIRKEFVPSLVRSHFASALSDYKLEIRDEEQENIIYSSESGSSILGDGDASERMLTLRLENIHISGGTVAFAAAPLSAALHDQFFSFHFQPSMAHEIPMGHVSKPVFNAWKLTAVHRSGSLDAAVGRLRRKNLGISFSILGLLAASVTIVLTSTARARRLARQQMEFVSAVSHELRTPLAVIRSAGENLADGVVRQPDQLRSYGEVIRNEGRRLTDMVEQILDYAGIQSGSKRRSFVEVDMPKLLDDALNAFEVPIRENGFTIARRVPAEAPPVLGDPIALKSALQNLIGNAIKYGASGRWIGLSIFTENHWLKLSVEDRGSGILSSDLPHIFEPFYRGRSAVDAQIHGSGLGLSIVKETVDSHGGRLDVKSDPANGSTFCIALPIAQAAPESRSE